MRKERWMRVDAEFFEYVRQLKKGYDIELGDRQITKILAKKLRKKKVFEL